METDARVDGLLDRWEVMHQQGTPVTIDDLCADCPELVAEVRRRIGVLREMDSALDTEVHPTSPDANGPSWRRPGGESRPASCFAGHGGLLAGSSPRSWRAGRSPDRPPAGAGPHGRAQADPARQAPRRGTAAVPPRGRHHGPAATPRHRADLRPGTG